MTDSTRHNTHFTGSQLPWQPLPRVTLLWLASIRPVQDYRYQDPRTKASAQTAARRIPTSRLFSAGVLASWWDSGTAFGTGEGCCLRGALNALTS